MVNALSVDVEDWYHVNSLRDVISTDDWCRCKSRVVDNTLRTLDMLGRFGVTGTFFIVGCVAEKYPKIVKEIDKRGHEIGTHGYAHKTIPEQSIREFAFDLRRSIEALERITKKRVIGYRAPSWSITKDNISRVMNVLVRNDLKYDSSVYPVRLRYGIPDADRFVHEVIRGFYEVPLSTIRILNSNVPIAGGFFLRAVPYGFTRWSIRRLNRTGARAVVYFHTWEIDEQTPRINTSLGRRLIHYHNISTMERKIHALLSDFKFTSIRNAFLCDG